MATQNNKGNKKKKIFKPNVKLDPSQVIDRRTPNRDGKKGK